MFWLLSFFLVHSYGQIGYGVLGGFGGYGGYGQYGTAASGYGNQFGTSAYRTGNQGTAVGSQGLAAGYDVNRAVAMNGASQIDFSQAAQNSADAYNCAAYICVQFSNEHASGIDTVSSYNNAVSSAAGNLAQGASNGGSAFQLANQFVNQDQLASQYVVPTFPYYSLGYGYGQGSGFNAGYNGDYGHAVNNAAMYAQKVSQSGNANAGQKYLHDANAMTTQGGSCKQYVCASSSQLQAFMQNGPNYSSSASGSDTGDSNSFQNGYASAANQASGDAASDLSAGANSGNTATYDGTQVGTAFGGDAGFSGFQFRR